MADIYQMQDGIPVKLNYDDDNLINEQKVNEIIDAKLENFESGTDEETVNSLIDTKLNSYEPPSQISHYNTMPDDTSSMKEGTMFTVGDGVISGLQIGSISSSENSSPEISELSNVHVVGSLGGYEVYEKTYDLIYSGGTSSWVVIDNEELPNYVHLLSADGSFVSGSIVHSIPYGAGVNLQLSVQNKIPVIYTTYGINGTRLIANYRWVTNIVASTSKYPELLNKRQVAILGGKPVYEITYDFTYTGGYGSWTAIADSIEDYGHLISAYGAGHTEDTYEVGLPFAAGWSCQLSMQGNIPVIYVTNYLSGKRIIATYRYVSK